MGLKQALHVKVKWLGTPEEGSPYSYSKGSDMAVALNKPYMVSPHFDPASLDGHK